MTNKLKKIVAITIAALMIMSAFATFFVYI